MGNAPSTSGPLQTCLNSIFANNSGAVSYPSDPLYQLDAVKEYNTAIPITPAAVVRPSTAEEVSRVVQCAVASSLKVQARSGGHSYANYCLGQSAYLPKISPIPASAQPSTHNAHIGGQSGALVIDMANFQYFSMNTTNWYATFGSGTLLGDLTQRLYDNGGRAIAHGVCPQVGTGGHLTIGGLGPLSRQYGTALDHIEEVEVVLANGTIARANLSQNQDIFFVSTCPILQEHRMVWVFDLRGLVGNEGRRSLFRNHHRVCRTYRTRSGTTYSIFLSNRVGYCFEFRTPLTNDIAESATNPPSRIHSPLGKTLSRIRI